MEATATYRLAPESRKEIEKVTSRMNIAKGTLTYVQLIKIAGALRIHCSYVVERTKAST